MQECSTASEGDQCPSDLLEEEQFGGGLLVGQEMNFAVVRGSGPGSKTLVVMCAALAPLSRRWHCTAGQGTGS